MFAGLADGPRYGLIGTGIRLLKFSNRSAGPRYWAHSLAVSGAVMFSTAPIAPQTNWTGLEKLGSANAPP